ncbi:hypothetical protein ACGFZQ_39540 [Streptomyces sp. NPDC048254]|uniref:hypothetical protein n=1 Tax=Streptomyces sp. NPDC048254 TaxID=3365525 RepID=UPI003714D888
MVRGLARDLGPRGINVNNIQPGPAANDRMSADSPAADAMLQWLALSRITGACLSTDGGFTA